VPAITAIIPVYNRAHVVGAAIESALIQDIPQNWEMTVTVVDDGSTDDLATTLRHFGTRVSLLRRDQNRGAAAARNFGVAAAAGNYIAFLDSDDTWLPGKLEKQITFMQTRGYLASCTAYVLVRGTQRTVSPAYATGTLKLSDLAWGCFVSPGSTLVCAREVFDQVGDFDIRLQRLEDWDWLLRFAKMHDLGFLAEPLAAIEIGPHRDANKVLSALEVIRLNHVTSFSPRLSRHFEAALAVERAAAHFRSGHTLAAVPALAQALRLVPFGNRAFGAVLHNRLRRS
jgi:glycosyltransferase involved in cell wall biosynthesis